MFACIHTHIHTHKCVSNLVSTNIYCNPVHTLSVVVNEEASDVVCFECKGGDSTPPNNIVVCDRCTYGTYVSFR